MAKERRVVFAYRFRADQDGVDLLAQAAGRAARRRAGNPFGVAPVVADLPVERHCDLDGHEGPPGRHVFREGRNQRLGRARDFLVREPFARDPRLCECALRLAAILWVGVGEGVDDARDSGRGDRIGARADAPRLRARLQRDVKDSPSEHPVSCPGCPDATASPLRVLDGRDFGVVAARAPVPALADDLAVLDDDRADGRVGARVPAAAPREVERAGHETGVGHCASDLA